MRKPAMAVLTAVAFGLTLAACADDEEPTPAQPTPGAATPTPGEPGQVASCVVGDWRSTEVTAEVGGDMANVSVTGGGGVALTVGPDGAVTIDFSGMEPASFTGEVIGTEVSGELTYDGQATGTIRTGADETSGTWEPEETNWDDVRVTADLTEPVEARPLDGTPIGEVVDSADQWTGDVVDVDPLLAEGDYECQNDTLALRPRGDDTGFTWTLTRA